MEWININDSKPSEGMEITLIWICEEDGCIGTTNCTVMDGKYLVKPGVFLQSNEVVTYWYEIPKLPDDIQRFYNHHNNDDWHNEYYESMLDNPEDHGLI